VPVVRLGGGGGGAPRSRVSRRRRRSAGVLTARLSHVVPRALATLSHPLRRVLDVSTSRFPATRPPDHGAVGDGGGALVISCDDCTQQGTDTCEDCVVTFLCGRQPGDAVVVDVAEARALRLLGEAGLVPRLRQVHRTG